VITLDPKDFITITIGLTVLCWAIYVGLRGSPRIKLRLFLCESTARSIWSERELRKYFVAFHASNYGHRSVIISQVGFASRVDFKEKALTSCIPEHSSMFKFPPRGLSITPCKIEEGQRAIFYVDSTQLLDYLLDHPTDEMHYPEFGDIEIWTHHAYDNGVDELYAYAQDALGNLYTTLVPFWLLRKLHIPIKPGVRAIITELRLRFL
jgi:hypothetical protein